ncbi:NAD(P)-dependent oxidoreductase [Bordetella bronchialis]|uniref:Oxidoreductase n=1 Tax=Bordetella bronchialis TaxID=463025 RepID=A0A193FL94_9BORD|nr:NAD(P)-dependent oxidoreductase [Bordetella bronchialis]ANN67879.1 oxidoreductase [Bordetella bronchialis]ANN72969.1 oxidoreductase [Bordetella bronchialis]
MHIGFIGLGNMGRAIAANLIKGGHTVTVWNRSPQAAAPLRELGARVADSPAQACDAEAVFSMLADDQAVEQIFVNDGALAGMRKGAVHVNMATISIPAAQRLADAHAAQGVGYVAAPVMGRPDAAAAAKLTLLVAGKADAVAAVEPLFGLIGHKTVMLGEAPHSANAMKLTVNFILTSAVEALAEGAALANAYGIGTGTLVDLLTSTILPGPLHTGYGALMTKGSYQPASFRARLGLKDVLLAQEAAREAGASLPLSDVVAASMRQAVDQGLGDHDLAVLGQVALDRNKR